MPTLVQVGMTGLTTSTPLHFPTYNMTSHTATRFAPVYLLRGYIPTTRSTLVHHPEGITRPATGTGSHNLKDLGNIDETSLHPATLEMSEAFHATHHQA